MTSATPPRAQSALADLFSNHERILLAVSGGRDSLALLLLAKRWAEADGSAAAILAATVDHGIRAAADAEANRVAALCGVLDVPHATLRVVQPAPDTGIQAWARNARYDLLTAHARATECSAIATGHQADDQAETVLMRLARGSGVAGLSAMHPLSWRDGIAILRPLLDTARTEITAFLEDAQVPWCDDPSNVDPTFERSAFMQHRPSLDALGLTASAIGLSARRIGEASGTLDWALAQAMTTLPACVAALETAMYGDLDRSMWMSFPIDLRRRVLSHVLWHVSGNGQCGTSPPLRLDRLERLVDRLGDTDDMRETFAGCLVAADRHTIRVFREPGRNGFPRIELAPGTTKIWDNRFKVSLPASAPEPVTVLAGAELPRELRKLEKVATTVVLPPQAAAAMPTCLLHDGVRDTTYPAHSGIGETPRLAEDGMVTALYQLQDVPPACDNLGDPDGKTS